MKLGVFSDIHGNLFSFENIYVELKREKCDLYLFLGDICGYYYRQKEIMDMLADLPHLAAIAGNHDTLFLKSLEDEELMRSYTHKYGLSSQFLKETIDSNHLDFLRNLPGEFHLETEGIAAFHGSPWDPLEEYIYPDSPMERFKELPFKLVFLGHTHRPMDIKLQGIRVINPGSAGQPRDGGWPTYALYDTGTKELKIKQVPYNVNALVDEIKKRKDENPYLIRVLHRIKEWQN
jgi:putative phosphoesterase